MDNFERYSLLHDEVMRRLEDGEITTEQAKDVNDVIFNKYIVESVGNKVVNSIKDIINKIESGIYNFKYRNERIEHTKINYNKLDDETKEKIDEYKKILKSFDNPIKKIVDDAWEEYSKQYEPKEITKSIIQVTPKDKIFGVKRYNKDKFKCIEIIVFREYLKSQSFKTAENIEAFTNILSEKIFNDKTFRNESIPTNLIPSLSWDTTKPFKLEILACPTVKIYKQNDIEKLL